jgi:hypothetical protein
MIVAARFELCRRRDLNALRVLCDSSRRRVFAAALARRVAHRCSMVLSSRDDSFVACVISKSFKKSGRDVVSE